MERRAVGVALAAVLTVSLGRAAGAIPTERHLVAIGEAAIPALHAALSRR